LLGIGRASVLPGRVSQARDHFDENKQRAFISLSEKLLNSLAADEVVVFADAVHPTYAARAAGCWTAPEVLYSTTAMIHVFFDNASRQDRCPAYRRLRAKMSASNSMAAGCRREAAFLTLQEIAGRLRVVDRMTASHRGSGRVPS
jgi:hypothetical protein